jgi:hypothetical protein
VGTALGAGAAGDPEPTAGADPGAEVSPMGRARKVTLSGASLLVLAALALVLAALALRAPPDITASGPAVAVPKSAPPAPLPQAQPMRDS